MGKRRWYCLSVWIVVGLTISLFSIGCDKGTEPKTQVLTKDYRVFFAEPGSGPLYKLFTFHPTTRHIDSADIPWDPTGDLTVSADGSRLYVSNRNSIAVVDAHTLAKISELPYKTPYPLQMSVDNRFIAIVGERLLILNANDFSVAFQDTVKCEAGSFSEDGNRFYCVVGWNTGPGKVYVVDLAQPGFPITLKSFAAGGVLQIVPSHNESLWFLYINKGYGVSSFEVFDYYADSILFWDDFSPGLGFLVLQPNEKSIFYTNPGSFNMDIELPFNFKRFDVDELAIGENYVDSALFTVRMTDGNDYRFPPNELAVTPDNRWLVLFGGNSPGRVIYLFDIERDSLVYRQDWGGVPTELTSPSIQKNL